MAQGPVDAGGFEPIDPFAQVAVLVRRASWLSLASVAGWVVIAAALWDPLGRFAGLIAGRAGRSQAALSGPSAGTCPSGQRASGPLAVGVGSPPKNG